MNMAEVIKTYTLYPGESFTLPPNAVLLGATDVDSLENSCEDLIDLEPLVCYVCRVASLYAEGDHSSYYEGGGQWGISGYILDGKEIKFNSFYSPLATGHFSSTDLANLILEIKKIPGVINVSHGVKDKPLYGVKHYFMIKTIPSVGDNNLQLTGLTWFAPNVDGFTKEVKLYFGLQTRESALTGDWAVPAEPEDLLDCPTDA